MPAFNSWYHSGKISTTGIQMNFNGDDIHIPNRKFMKYIAISMAVCLQFMITLAGFTPDLLSIVLVTRYKPKEVY
jgi:hypothetical protein